MLDEIFRNDGVLNVGDLKAAVRKRKGAFFRPSCPEKLPARHCYPVSGGAGQFLVHAEALVIFLKEPIKSVEIGRSRMTKTRFVCLLQEINRKARFSIRTPHMSGDASGIGGIIAIVIVVAIIFGAI